MITIINSFIYWVFKYDRIGAKCFADMVLFNPLNLMTCYYYRQFIDKKMEGKVI